MLPQDTEAVTNEDVRAKIQQAIGSHEDLVSTVKGLVNTILQGTVKGGRRQGRQRKRWEDNIREWTGLEFASPRGQWRTGGNGGNWLQNHLWCPSDACGQGMDDGDDELFATLFHSKITTTHLTLYIIHNSVKNISQKN